MVSEPGQLSDNNDHTPPAFTGAGVGESESDGSFYRFQLQMDRPAMGNSPNLQYKLKES